MINDFKTFLLTEAPMTSKNVDGVSGLEMFLLKNKDALKQEWEIESPKTGTAPVYTHKGEKISEIPHGTRFHIKNRAIRTIGKTKLLNTELGWIPAKYVKKPLVKVDVMTYEIIATESLNSAIQKAKAQLGTESINILIGKWLIEDVVKADRDIVKGMPKADVVLIDKYGKFVGFISLKKPGGPRVIDQFSGISRKALPPHKEIDDFINAVYDDVGSSATNKYAVYRPVKDKRLVKMAVYGPNYGGNFGIDNCHCIGQGTPILVPTKKKNTFELQFTEIIGYNGDISWMKGMYTPVFAAVYKAKRVITIPGSNKRVRNVRAGITTLYFPTHRTMAREI